jgi:hypothetical protein
LLGRESSADPVPASPSTAEIEVYTDRKAGGPTFANFRLDLGGTNASPWNRMAACVFATAFIKSGWYTCKDKGTIRNGFLAHLRTIRTHFNRQQAGPAEIPRTVLDECKAAARWSRHVIVSLFAYNALYLPAHPYIPLAF